MKIKIETNGTPEGTKLINLRTGEEVKNIEVSEVNVFHTFYMQKAFYDEFPIDNVESLPRGSGANFVACDEVETENDTDLTNIFHSIRREND